MWHFAVKTLKQRLKKSHRLKTKNMFGRAKWIRWLIALKNHEQQSAFAPNKYTYIHTLHYITLHYSLTCQVGHKACQIHNCMHHTLFSRGTCSWLGLGSGPGNWKRVGWRVNLCLGGRFSTSTKKNGGPTAPSLEKKCLRNNKIHCVPKSKISKLVT